MADSVFNEATLRRWCAETGISAEETDALVDRSRKSPQQMKHVEALLRRKLNEKHMTKPVKDIMKG